MFRYLTLVSKENLGLDVLLETKQETKDYYNYFLFKNGALDYIDEFVTPEERIEGIRLDKHADFAYTIVCNKIVWENVVNLIGQVRFLKNL